MPRKSTAYKSVLDTTYAEVLIAENKTTGEVGVKVHPKRGYVVHSIGHPTSYTIWVSPKSKKLTDK